jgi:phenylacetate-CoA ligase
MQTAATSDVPDREGSMGDADRLPLADLAAMQARRWDRQRAYVAERSAFYRAHGAKRLPASLTGLADVAFTDKAMLRRDQAANPPFGSYLAAPPEAVIRLHRTSGTTGEAMNLALSAADAVLTAQIGGRAQRAAGLGPGHRVVHCLNYQLWMGGFTDHTTLEATGATVVPFGVGDSVRLIRTIRELAITAISCTPSYPAVLERVLAEQFPGLAPRELGLQLALFGGEPGLDDPGFRSRLERTWGFRARNANYGVTDVLCNFSGQCAASPDLHFMALDALYPELIEAASGRLLPWAEGSEGELVLTHLAKDCQPLVRFRTGDIVVLTGLGPAPCCGRTAPRFRVIGRADDMVVVRGINVFPSSVAATISAIPELGGEYRIVLEGPPPYDRLPLEAEVAADQPGADRQAVAQRLEAAIKAQLGVTARARILDPDTLPRTAGKTARVVRGPRRE